MLFDRMQLYCKPDLDLLKLVDTSICPSSFTDNEKHFVYFNDADAPPIWCSEPVLGKAVTPVGFANRVSELIRSEGTLDAQLRLLESLLHSVTDVSDIDERLPIELLSSSFTLAEFSSTPAE